MKNGRLEWLFVVRVSSRSTYEGLCKPQVPMSYPV